MKRPWYNTRPTADTSTKVIESQLHAALCCLVWRMLLLGRARRTSVLARPWLPLSMWAEHRCRSITSARSALECAFISNCCVRADWTVVGRLIILTVCLHFLGRIYLFTCVCVCVFGWRSLRLMCLGRMVLVLNWRLLCRRERFTRRPWMRNKE